MTFLVVISVAVLGWLTGWYMREIKYHYDQRMAEDRILRTIRDRIDREDAGK